MKYIVLNIGIEFDYGTRKGRPKQIIRVIQCGQLRGLPCAACESVRQRDAIEYETDDYTDDELTECYDDEPNGKQWSKLIN